ncbi:hypothetical protein GJ496_009038 [Pomphorhynchus laevis]|nr:hypothetical protein GJ496_009038 [Pomphorhynchus laevis]
MAKFDVPKTLLTDVHDLLQYDWHSNDNNDSDYKNKLLKILCDRFANGYNSTFVGDLLLQINSFRSRSHQLRFNPFTHDILSHRSEIQPLALSILSYAIFRIQWTKQDQSIIMFGNKGSGKSDIANNYIRAITDCCSNSKIGSMINSIVYFNQMLTCYRTKDNPSSSGCINQYKLHFDVCSGLICSASIRHYLFDRNKLFTLRPACGNFRIFYAVVSALAPTAELSNQQTNPSRYFVGINSVGIGQWPRILVNDNNPPSSIEMIDFRQWHEQFIDALKNCMFSGKDIDFIHDVLIAIVLLGDIQFERMQGDEGRNATYIYNDKIAVRVMFYNNKDNNIMC